MNKETKKVTDRQTSKQTYKKTSREELKDKHKKERQNKIAGSWPGADWGGQVVGFVPTGWMYEMRKTGFPVRRKGPCHIHLVPYSEHSSYAELRDYVRWLRPAQVRIRVWD